MQVRKCNPSRSGFLLFAGVAAVVMLATVAPSSAAGTDYKGWFAALDLATTQPTSLDQHYANHVDASGSASSQTRLIADNDADFTWALGVGYSWGKMGALQVSYWSFDNDDQVDDTLNGGVYNAIFGYGYNGGGQYAYNSAGVDTAFESSVEASTIDVDYVRGMEAGEKMTIHWLAGLRVASYEEEQFVETDDTYTVYTQGKRIDNDAWGLKVGAGATFNFTESFSLKAGATLSFLQTEIEGESFQAFDGTVSDITQAEDDNVRGEIREYGIKAIWHAGPVDIFAGYNARNWEGVPMDAVPGNEGGHFAIGDSGKQGRDSVSFNSWDVGLKWMFGGK